MSNAIGGLIKYINNLGKDKERYYYDLVMVRSALASTEVAVRRLASDINRVVVWSKGDEDDWKTTADRSDSSEGSKRVGG